MDKIKDILRMMIQYRFWIVVGIGALLPALAYLLGSGPVKAKAAQETQNITKANTEVEQYASGVVKNGQYKELVAEKHDQLAKDVLATWKKLYDRQAPLLKWPTTVAEQFEKWGRKWPEAEQADASVVQLAIIDYVNEYPKAVTDVYKSFNPYDPTAGTGNAVAPPELELLRPAQFTIDNPPSLGKVWEAQERLWIQSSMLDVVAQVNKDAKDWDSAIVKQINLLEVGNYNAQDQRSMAKGDILEEAPELVAPGTEEVPAEEAGVEASMPGMGGMSEMMGMGGMGGRMNLQGKAEAVYYLKSSEGSENTQFRVVPVKMSVLLDLNDLQEFLVAFENSPMAIQIMDFEMAKPSIRVTKPLQGEEFKLALEQGTVGGMMGGMMGMYGGGMRGATLPGSSGNRMTGFGGMGMAMPGGRGGMAGMPGMGMMSEMGGMMGGQGGMPSSPKALDKRGVDRAGLRKEIEEREKLAKPTSVIHDPYYNIIEVTVYGQARFYNPPPAEAAAESNAEGGVGPDPAAPPEDAATAKSDPAEADPGEAKGTSPKSAAPVNDATKAETPAPEVEGGPQSPTEAPKAKSDATQGKADVEAPRS